MCEKGSEVDIGDYLKPKEMCCACGGGQQITSEEVNWFESGMICRKSDYRTIASDPEYDVTSVQADVYEQGYYMLMSVTATKKDNPQDQATVIYVFGGWQCKVELEVEIQE